MKPYNPFSDLPQNKLSSEIRVRSTHSNKVSINEYIVHKSIGKGSYAQVRAGYDLIGEQPVALRVINRKNLARKLGLQKTDEMIANSSRIHLLLRRSIQLYALVYVPKIFEQLEDQQEIPVSHELYNNFRGDFTLNGKINIVDNFSDEPSLRSTTPRYSNEYCYDNCIIQVLELANAGTLKDLDAGEAQLRALLTQVAECLQEMHMQHIIHCDLKADNIMILEKSKKLTAKLTDFDTSIILDRKHSKRLSYIRIQDIFAFSDIENFNFVITDAFAARYVGEIITTPAISAPETRSFANVFKGKHTDLWEFGQLFLTQFCENHKNLSLQRGSAEYKIVEQEYGLELADLISGLTEYNSAYRYDMKSILQHEFFERDDAISLNAFHMLITNAKARCVILDEAQMLQSGEQTTYRSRYQLLRFWMGIYAVLNHEVRTVFLTAGEQFTLRETQCQRVENFIQAANQALREILKQIVQSSTTEHRRPFHASYEYEPAYYAQFASKIEFYDLADLYAFLTPEICCLFNQNSLLQRCIVEIIDIRDLKHLSGSSIYRAAKILHYFNLLLRLAAFNINTNYYDTLPTPIQQFESTFEMDVLRRKQELARATQVPAKHIEVVESFASLEAFLGKDSTTVSQENITPAAELDTDSDSDADLPCKYVEPVTSARNQMSISLPRLHLVSGQTNGAPQVPEVPVPKATFEHREVNLENVQLPEVSNLGSDSLSEENYVLTRHNNTVIRNDDPQVLRQLSLNSSESQLRRLRPRDQQGLIQSKEQVITRIKGVVQDQHIDFQNISSESSSSEIEEARRKGFGHAEKLPFEPLNWQLVKQTYGNAISEDALSSETEEMVITLGPKSNVLLSNADPFVNPSASDEQSADSKLQTLFQVTKVDEIENCVVDGHNFDIGECSDSYSDL